MKVIDLLSKIANSEPIPYRIKYNENIYYYNLDLEWYIREDLKNELFIDRHHLRDNVEIIEGQQEHKIPEKLVKRDFLNYENLDQVDADLDFIIDKINEIIDYLKEKNNE